MAWLRSKMQTIIMKAPRRAGGVAYHEALQRGLNQRQLAAVVSAARWIQGMA